MARRIAALIAGLFIAVAALAGCSHSAPVAYAPAAYGVNGQCFYVDDLYEAQQLLAAGLCPAGWVPAPMPLYFHEEYDSFYSSPAYVNRYVLVSHRTVYVTHETTFHTTYATQISTASKSATWKGSNGKTVSGAKVNTAKMKFSTGSGSTGKIGGGSLRSGTSGGSTGGSSGGSGSGGSKTGTTVKSKTGSGSVGGGSLRGRK